MLLDLVGNFSHFVEKGEASSKEKEYDKEAGSMLFKTGLKSIRSSNPTDVKLKVHFPYVITVKADDLFTGGDVYRTYKLRSIVEPGDSQNKQTLATPEQMDDQGRFWGVKAVYEITEHKGSRQQKGPAYVFGESPSFVRLRAIEDIKSDERLAYQQGRTTQMGAFGNDVSFFDAAILARQEGKDPLEFEFGDNDEVIATDREVKVKGWTTTVAERPNLKMDDLMEEEVTESDANNIAFLKGSRDDSDTTSEKDSTTVKEYLENLSAEEVFKLSAHFEVNNMKGLIAIFEHKNNLDTAEEFIQRLKDMC